MNWIQYIFHWVACFLTGNEKLSINEAKAINAILGDLENGRLEKFRVLDASQFEEITTLEELFADD